MLDTRFARAFASGGRALWPRLKRVSDIILLFGASCRSYSQNRRRNTATVAGVPTQSTPVLIVLLLKGHTGTEISFAHQLQIKDACVHVAC